MSHFRSPLYSIFSAAGLCAILLSATGCPSPATPAVAAREDAAANAPPAGGATVRSAESNPASTASETEDAGVERVEGETPAPRTSDATSVEASREEPSSSYGAAYGGDYGDAKKKYPPLFEGWPKPTLTLYFTGRQHGYIEPCGCTGLANQKGGLNRRHVFLEQLQEKGWNPVAMDIGNQVRRFGRQPEIKFQTTINGFKEIGYEAIAYGPDDLRLSAGELLSAAIGVDGKPAPFVCANVSILGQTPAMRIVQAEGKRIGVTAILGEAEQRSVSSDEIELSNADAALEKVVPKLKEAGCDIYVLLSHTSIDESKRLGAKFPLFDLVVTAGSAGEPAHRLEPIEGSTGQLVQIGAKGMHVSVVGVFDDADDRFRLQRAPLDGRFSDSREMLDLMASYQQQLEAVGLEGLAVRPLPHPSGYTFVGSQTCADCHYEEYEIWKETPHAHGTDSLVHPAERSEIPRHFDPECLSCHVTGWNPQEYYPYKSGYLSLEETKHATQMGCENCHGPGSHHVAAENGELDDIEKYRQDMVLTLKDARDTCLKCHDLDNSPGFHVEGAFEEYWERIEH